MVEKIANKYNLPFIPLMDEFTDMCDKNGMQLYLYDGTHPNAAGAMLIAERWLQKFKELENLH